ncbi:RagB/SusD family nutrient uptake outer membrane protein [Pedobacter africanus]|uniref:RagB/SusD domain-containing protein n=1 Tax=Pedobacter africanus TaxID=151894 RepID=A0A1W2CNY0_9SPHI|nr:RagB/SusD family nutrient uptake outer membrane protein [Pedobacter africanus]SMC86901.1 RagB/SusD domain-containing protein [Pedobacter africanus]
MKNIKYILLLGAVLISLTSCKKYLDVVPKGKIIPKTTSDYRLLLNQTTAKGSSVGFVSSFSNDLLMADDMEVNAFSASFYKASDQNLLMFADHIYQDFESDPDWEALYNQVYVANLVIKEVMDSEGRTEAEKNKLQAEARVHRAYAFLMLVNLYAKAYSTTGALADMGVPLRTGLDFEEKLNRATVQEVYNFILNDLQLALGKLPLTPEANYNYRPVQASAEALLARAYLYMSNFAEAFKYADASLRSYSTLNNYNSLPASVVFAGNFQLPLNLQNKEILQLKSTISNTSLFYANAALIALYDKQNDLRFKTLYASDAIIGLNNGYISTDWTGNTPAKGPSTAEMYLTRAECYARNGKTQEALQDLNTLRASRYKTGSSYMLTAGSPAEVLSLVKAERRRELAFRGFRLFDIKRYNVIDGDNITITHAINGKTYTLAPASPRSVLPIGRKYIDLNPEILQNPR